MNTSEETVREIVQRIVDRTMGYAAPTGTNPIGQEPGRQEDQERLTIAIGADHGGYTLKEYIKTVVSDQDYRVMDCGTYSTAPVDYPDIAYSVAQLVSSNQAQAGILLDGAGIGSCIAANKVPGIRAALCYDQSTAANSREHNHANVLTIGAGLTGPNLARQIVLVWLDTPYGEERHALRVAKIADIERRFLVPE